jgi:hypothetical protein
MAEWVGAVKQRRGKARSKMAGVALTQADNCRDCGREPEMYLVDDRLWNRAGLEPHDGCCLCDLSARIGRPLRDADFVHMIVHGRPADWEGILAEDVLVRFSD